MGYIEKKEKENGSRSSADDLLKKLNDNIKNGSKATTADGGQTEGFRNDFSDSELLSDFFEKEISEVDLPDFDTGDENAYIELDNEDDDDFVYGMLHGTEPYVANHGDEEESTKVAGDNIQAKPWGNELASVYDEDEYTYTESDDETDQTDRNLMFTFGQEDELKSEIGEDRVKEMAEDNEKIGKYFESSATSAHEEFKSYDQTDDIVKEYEKKHKYAVASLIAVSLFMIISLIAENISKIGAKLPDILNPGAYPVVYTMLALQILLFSAAAVYKPLLRGLKAITKFKPIPESIVASATVLTVVYDVVTALLFPLSATAVFSFPVIFSLWLLSLSELLGIKREIMTFSVVSAKGKKFALSKLNIENSELETETFYEYLPDKPSIYKISKTGFVESYFRRNTGILAEKSIASVLLPISVAVCVVIFAIQTLLTKSISEGLTAAFYALMLCSPSALLLAFSFPLFKASGDAFTDDGAIVGESSVNEYANATVVSFEDKEVFPSYSVKVKSVKIYGNNRIDRVIYNTASVFSAMGGPLNDVFDIATVELGKSKDIELRGIEYDGVEAVVDGQSVCIGKSDYVIRMGLTPFYDMEDDQAEKSGDISIMYVVCGGVVAAKMYIQYIIDPDFKVLLDQLKKTGVCVGIKTLDPNIDDTLLGTQVDLRKYPVRIIRCRELGDMNNEAENTDSGLVSKHSTKGLLKLVAACEHIKNASKTNSMLCLFSLGVGALLVVFLMLSNMTSELSSFLIGLYHIFWTMPIIFTSKSV